MVIMQPLIKTRQEEAKKETEPAEKIETGRKLQTALPVFIFKWVGTGAKVSISEE